MKAEEAKVSTKTKHVVFFENIDRPIFLGAALLLLPFILFGGIFPELFSKDSAGALSWITDHWDWFYLSSVNIFVLLALLLAFSPFGSIRLGRDEDRPEYSRLSWFALLFSAGMGIGLVFWSIAEPLYHFSGPPIGEAGSPASARLAFSIFFHHWGIHAWGTYVAVGLPLAYFQFRKGYSGGVSSCLRPFLSVRRNGVVAEFSPTGAIIAKAVDILAVWATVLGVVTSLGLGALQIASGLSITFGIKEGAFATGVIIVVITLLFIVSALSGVARGIRYLSLANVAIMVSFLLFFLLLGPEPYIIVTFFTALRDYLANFIPLSTTLTLFGNSGWTKSWTVFYWAWWIAWAPFVGAFIASISRGRTIREFVLTVMILPALFSFLFSSALGGTAINMQLFEAIPLMETVSKSIEATLFTTLQHLPFYSLTAVVANILIASFFITSADSATYVVCRFSMKTVTPETRVPGSLIVYWGVVLGGLALVLVVSGGLKALQTASIVGALPFVVVIYFVFAALIRDLFAEKHNTYKNT